MRIEDLISKHKDQLDLESPSDQIWEGIRSEWKQPEKKRFEWWRAAAIVFITLSVGLLMYSLSLQNQVNELASLGDISDEYQEIETAYENEISNLEAVVNVNELIEDTDFQWIIEEMKTLEEINELYRKDIGKAPDQEQLVGALIDYYEKKIKLLKKLELEITRTQKFRNDEKDNSDTVSI